MDNATKESNSEKTTSKTESNEQKCKIFSNEKTIKELQNGVVICTNIKPGAETVIAKGINETFSLNVMKNGTKQSYGGATEDNPINAKNGGIQGLEDTTMSVKDSVRRARESSKYEQEENLNDHNADDTVPRSHKNIENATGDEQKTAEKAVSREFFSSMVKILRSPVFVFSTLAATCLFLILTALTVFFPKVVQNQFNQTAARSGLLAGSFFKRNCKILQISFDLTISNYYKAFSRINTISFENFISKT